MRKVCFNLPVMFLERYLWEVNENNKSKVILVPKIVSALNLIPQKILHFGMGQTASNHNNCCLIDCHTSLHLRQSET